MPPMMLESKMVVAAPERLPAAIWRMNKRNVDRGRAGLLAGRVEAEIAALRLDPRLVGGQAAGADRRNCLSASPSSRRPGRTSDAPGGLAAIVMKKPQRLDGERLIPDRLVNRFATRDICQAGYGPRRRRPAAKGQRRSCGAYMRADPVPYLRQQVWITKC